MQPFDLLILGSSSASPTSTRNQTAQLLNISGRLFLVDCGEATQIQIRKYKAKFQSINHILISHLHGDHFFGLPGLLSSMHLLGRKRELNVYCPPKLKELVETINLISETQLNYTINWHTTSDKGINLLFEDEKVEVYSFPLKHRIFCTGFLFKEKAKPRKIIKEKLSKYNVSIAEIQKLKNGFDVENIDGKIIKNSLITDNPTPEKSYAYCSDTLYHESLIQYIKNCTLLYHESTFLNDKADRAKKTMHSTAKQAATIAKLSNVGKLLIGHFSARYSDLDDFIKEATLIFSNTELAIEGKLTKI
ncbi:MAG: ribonuclease Z [Bacteroidetes bacterium]|nr:ribonuclease Z [Bacteroidota bacterium]